MNSSGPGPAVRVEDDARQRGFTFQELARFAERAGLAVEAALGGFDEGLALDDPRANRMLLMLRRS